MAIATYKSGFPVYMLATYYVKVQEVDENIEG